MEDNYLITVVGEQTVDGESDKIEVRTTGSLTERDGIYFIKYIEYDSESADAVKNFIKADGDVVTITRVSALSTHLILEKGKRHQTFYRTPMGNLMIGIYTKSVEVDLSENGGEVDVSYTLDFDSRLASENRVYIKIEKKFTE